jgi:transcriptional regulator with PAS, ATPase and Fis domain
MVDTGEFRADLWSRLSGGVLHLPPLRERREDIGVLLPILLKRIAGRTAGNVKLSVPAARALLDHTWPLNIRELEKTLAVAWAVAQGAVLDLQHLPERVVQKRPGRAALPSDLLAGLSSQDLKNRERLLASLEKLDGNVSAVARQMGKGRTQIQRWIRRYGIK